VLCHSAAGWLAQTTLGTHGSATRAADSAASSPIRGTVLLLPPPPPPPLLQLLPPPPPLLPPPPQHRLASHCCLPLVTLGRWKLAELSISASCDQVNCVRFGWADASRQLLVSGCAAAEQLSLSAGRLYPRRGTAASSHRWARAAAACRDAAGDVLVWDLTTRRPCITLSGAHPGGAIEATIVAAEGDCGASWLFTCVRTPRGLSCRTNHFQLLHGSDTHSCVYWCGCSYPCICLGRPVLSCV
jgi:hypothetical protein